MTQRADTIFARASGAGRAGVAVFRLSGPEAFAIGERLCGTLPPPRRAALRTLRAPDGEIVDTGLALAFRGPASFTGEDVVELHLHGSRAVEAALYEALAALGARPAEAGEFARRALENGRLDLAQAEALADLIDAETSEQRRQALGQLGGRLSALAEGWRARLIAILAPLEADIDFPDEEDVPAAVAARAGPAIDALMAELRSYQADAARLRAIRSGVAIAILGAPNAGKSSLLNRLAGSDAAIVSPTPGTTRDVIEVRLDLGGLPALLADTAGLRAMTEDEIEAEGMRRALARAENADIRILVADAAAGAAGAADAAGLLRPGDFLVWNKTDLAPAPAREPPEGVQAFALSAKTGEGIGEFIRILTDAARARFRPVHETGLTRLRHARAVAEALDALARARGRIDAAPELAAEDARLAARALGRITGAVDVEDVLDEIFSSFCIGK
ncbi:tRNA uridine-5-carboxymethylaminomethyl(34) synthesis GTPase MnmE [Amphiplicatus metriothermophilus]|uniref:tRNA modification GTPase MnmE n=1 Tax=Amphiplicatus metriothermophilus TaxID=1519374 RepID=A0A239PJM3_9PROT|nr:tRNA uridine-5-carboxymethylaminomethyl(34) synthesis GTPase MnmE [Amphiplicatus metriothermophilus]MBB5517664.1 tRNA modification GTPase [Amphiplicatus metriothermophilus]SNT68002.1 tRNA modification GTPase trmE [Amphiplicatus metriothermophilus]